MAKDKDLEDFGIATAREGGIFLSGKAVNAFISLALIIFLARYLQPADYGIYTIVIAFSTFLGMGGNFGIATSIRRYLPVEKSIDGKGNIVASGFVVSALISLGLAIVGIMLSGSIATYAYGNASMGFAIEIASMLVFISVLLNMSIATLVAMRRSRKATQTVILYSSAELVFTVGLVMLGYGINGAVAALAIGSVIGFAYAFGVIAKEIGIARLHATLPTMKTMTSFSIPVFVSNASQNGVLSFGTLIAGMFASSYLIGNYGIAQKFGKFVELIIVSSTFVLLPAFSAAASSDRFSKKMQQVYSNSLYYSMLVLFPIIAYVAATCMPLVRLLFSSAYSFAPLYLAIISIGTAIGIIGSYASMILLSYGASKRFMAYQLTVMAIELAAMLALIPFFGVMGLIIALFAIGPAAMDIVFIKELRKRFSIHQEYGAIARLSLSCIVMGLLLFLVSAALNERLIAIAANAVIAILIYPLLLARLGAIKKSKIEFISKTGNTLPRSVSRIIGLYVKYSKIFI
ncbi:MAG: oligosaccharide flippase family protein [Candidatus Micrarchaeaceae archaeon]